MAPLLQIVLLAVVSAAAAYDLKLRKIPNWLNLSGVILGIGLNCLLWHGPGLLTALLGLGLALLVYFPLFLARGMGAGDVKLMAAIGSIAGPRNWLIIFIATALLGGVAAIILVLRKRRFFSTFSNLGVIISELSAGRMPFKKDANLDFRAKQAMGLPHGAVIALGSIVFLSAALLQ
jgi:prepilin peptidase CpaA